MLVTNAGRTRWLARAALGVVFAWNVQCALVFLLAPERYAPGLELTGLSGRVAVQAFGILFLMWNATYPPVIINPEKHRTLFRVVLVQQAIGVGGDLWLWSSLPAGHQALGAAILRFVAFDAAGLLLLVAAYALLRGACAAHGRRTHLRSPARSGTIHKLLRRQPIVRGGAVW